jgi:hypothetical protein
LQGRMVPSGSHVGTSFIECTQMSTSFDCTRKHGREMTGKVEPWSNADRMCKQWEGGGGTYQQGHIQLLGEQTLPADLGQCLHHTSSQNAEE